MAIRWLQILECQNSSAASYTKYFCDHLVKIWIRLRLDDIFIEHVFVPSLSINIVMKVCPNLWTSVSIVQGVCYLQSFRGTYFNGLMLMFAKALEIQWLYTKPTSFSTALSHQISDNSITVKKLLYIYHQTCPCHCDVLFAGVSAFPWWYVRLMGGCRVRQQRSARMLGPCGTPTGTRPCATHPHTPHILRNSTHQVCNLPRISVENPYVEIKHLCIYIYIG